MMAKRAKGEIFRPTRERGSVVTKPRAAACRVCENPERSLVDRAMLEYGQLPRSVMRRFAGISRRALQRHRAVCLEARLEAQSSEDAA
jgi:hypothetical protein